MNSFHDTEDKSVTGQATPGTPDLFPDYADKRKPDSATVLNTVRDELASILNDLDPDSR